jgi:hypothetical protein
MMTPIPERPHPCAFTSISPQILGKVRAKEHGDQFSSSLQQFMSLDNEALLREVQRPLINDQRPFTRSYKSISARLVRARKTATTYPKNREPVPHFSPHFYQLIHRKTTVIHSTQTL